jgi:predicted RNA-binding protein YlxR (DUF448 family)
MQSQDAETSGGPLRMCLGCRQRGLRSDLVRLVTASLTPDLPASVSTGSCAKVVVDFRKCLPGRGAWLHLSENCFKLAQRRKAFGRALRADQVDLSEVVSYVASCHNTGVAPATTVA